MLADRGSSVAGFTESLGDVAPVANTPLPRWATDALDLLDLLGTRGDAGPAPRLVEVTGSGLPESVDPDQPWRFHAGFRDWLAVAEERVRDWTDAVPLTEAARRDLVLDLARRQLAVTGPLLMATAAARESAPLFVEDPWGDWVGLFDGHRRCAAAGDQLAAVERVHCRSCAPACGPSFLLVPSAPVARIELSAGDQHGDGRGVARLRLLDEVRACSSNHGRTGCTGCWVR